ncbi:hypothetical protein HYR69_08115 [Candidatus Sumerlaeota bacterium]|nr:hypothetical protein [Candidatus Sumerlaeota bacterium]
MKRLPASKIKFGSDAAEIDTKEKRVKLHASRTVIEYEHLISTIPLTELVKLSEHHADPAYDQRAKMLKHSATHIIGLGVRGAPSRSLATKCWMYFPEDHCPFYRATVFSNYSPNNVPNIREGWSLMCEVSESPSKLVNATQIVEETVHGAVATELVGRREDVIHTWYRRLPHGYPTPGLERDAALDFLLPRFEAMGIYPRGRFGAWKYEVSNQDHSLMQGVECVNRILKGEKETTLPHPEIANRPRKKL